MKIKNRVGRHCSAPQAKLTVEQHNFDAGILKDLAAIFSREADHDGHIAKRKIERARQLIALRLYYQDKQATFQKKLEGIDQELRAMGHQD